MQQLTITCAFVVIICCLVVIHSEEVVANEAQQRQQQENDKSSSKAESVASGASAQPPPKPIKPKHLSTSAAQAPLPCDVTTPDFVNAEAKINAMVVDSPKRAHSMGSNTSPAPAAVLPGALSVSTVPSSVPNANKVGAPSPRLMQPSMHPDLHDIQLLASLQEEDLRQTMEALMMARERRRSHNAHQPPVDLNVSNLGRQPMGGWASGGAQPQAHSTPAQYPPNSSARYMQLGQQNVFGARQRSDDSIQRPMHKRHGYGQHGPAYGSGSRQSSQTRQAPPTRGYPPQQQQQLHVHTGQMQTRAHSRGPPVGVAGAAVQPNGAPAGSLQKSLPNLSTSKSQDRLHQARVSPAAQPQHPAQHVNARRKTSGTSNASAASGAPNVQSHLRAPTPRRDTGASAAAGNRAHTPAAGSGIPMPRSGIPGPAAARQKSPAVRPSALSNTASGRSRGNKSGSANGGAWIQDCF